MSRDAVAAGGAPVSELRVDGGACINDLLMQFQADLLGIPVVRPRRDRNHRTGRGLPWPGCPAGMAAQANSRNCGAPSAALFPHWALRVRRN